MNEYTTSMESFIGNFTQATLDRYIDCTDDPYQNIFEDDELDNEHILLQERGEDGEPFSCLKLDELDHDSPYAEEDDCYIGMKVPLPHPEGEMKQATVKQRKRNKDGTLQGTSNDNPILDTREYEVEFNDSSYSEYSANVLAENLYNHIDKNGHSNLLLSAIVDHEKDPNVALSKEDGYYEVNNTKKRRITTKGWQLKIEWKEKPLLRGGSHIRSKRGTEL